MPCVAFWKTGDRLSLSKNGAQTTTIRKDGVNIAAAATAAPAMPCTTYPTNAAVITIGPGVT